MRFFAAGAAFLVGREDRRRARLNARYGRRWASWGIPSSAG
jgi:hypothetical protein